MFQFLKDDAMQIKEPEEPLLSPTEVWNPGKRSTLSSLDTPATKGTLSNTDDDDSETENVPTILDLIGIHQGTNSPMIFKEPDFDDDFDEDSINLSSMKFETAKLNSEDLIKQFIKLFVDEGNVQMAVYLCLTVRNTIDLSDLPLEQYFEAAIELLRQMQLDTEATEMIRISMIDSIQQVQDNTFISLSCDNCKNQLLLPSKRRGRCQDCLNSVFRCSFCRIRVDGVYTWCSWCCHGGHLKCMDEWFALNSACPTGCGHQCVKTS